MIYLDYSATTPVSKELLKVYTNACNEYIGNPNSKHKLGIKSKKALEKSAKIISKEFNCYSAEIVFTSGASESNTTAIMGTINSLGGKGKHIITTKLEHKSILDIMDNLSRNGYIIDYVNILPNGIIDLLDLEKKICEDTILISINAVNSEVGYIQPLEKIRKIIDKKQKKIFFHSDLTQALGKIKIDLSYLDLASFSSHKIYAPIGCGILYINRRISISKLIYGTTNNTPYRGGTPALPLIVTFARAIEISQKNLIENNLKCLKLKNILIESLSKYPIKINSNDLCVPQILNISLLNYSNKKFLKKMSDKGVYLSTTTACCENKSDSESIALKEVTKNDEKISKTSIRISLSHYTKEEEIYRFLELFKEIYESDI